MAQSKYGIIHKIFELIITNSNDSDDFKQLSEEVRVIGENNSLPDETKKEMQLDCISKRIDNIVDCFYGKKENKGKVERLGIIKFEFLEYKEDEVVEFIKSILTLQDKDREFKSKMFQKIDVDRNYEQLFLKMNHEEEIKRFPYNKDKITEKGKSIRETNRKKAMDVANATDLKQREDLQRLATDKIRRYMIYVLEEIGNQKKLSVNICEGNVGDLTNYEIYWIYIKVWIRTIMACFDYSWFVNDFDIVNQDEEIEVPKINGSKEGITHNNLMEDFYRYLYMNDIRSELAEEYTNICKQLEIEKEINPVSIKEEYQLFNWENFREQYSYDKYIEEFGEDQCNKIFNLGICEVKNRSFSKRIEKCREFIEKISKKEGRTLSVEKIEYLRTAYRMCYLEDDIKFKKSVAQLMNDVVDDEKDIDKKQSKNSYVNTLFSVLLNTEYKNGAKFAHNRRIFLKGFYSEILTIIDKVIMHNNTVYNAIRIMDKDFLTILQSVISGCYKYPDIIYEQIKQLWPEDISL